MLQIIRRDLITGQDEYLEGLEFRKWEDRIHASQADAINSGEEVILFEDDTPGDPEFRIIALDE